MALTQVSSAGIKNAEVKTEDILDANITTAKVADNAITGAKVADNLEIPDNNKIMFGTGNDLEIFHDGTRSYIQSSTGNLEIQSDNFWVEDKANGHGMIHAVADGGVELYYDNVKKFETYTSGVEVTGNLWLKTAGGKIQLNDNIKLIAGNGDDIQIYHDGNSYITNSTGQFAVQGDDLKLRSTTDLENYIVCTHNGAVDLYHNGVKKFETTSAGADLHEDTDKVIRFTGGISEIGSLTGFQTTNTAGDALVGFGIRASEIRLATGSAERVRIDSSGRVGIGSTNPVASTALFGGTQNCLKVGGSAAPQVRIASDTANQADLVLQAGNSGSDAHIANTASNGDLVFHTHNGTQVNERLRIYDDGAIIKPNQPSASAYFSGSDAGGNGGKISNAYAIPSSTRWNIGSHYSTSTGKFTCPVAGKYAVTFSSNISLSNLSVGDYYSLQVRINGSSRQFNYDTVYNTSWQHLAFTNIIDCSANDYLQLFLSSTGNNTFGVDNSSAWNQLHFYLLH